MNHSYLKFLYSPGPDDEANLLDSLLKKVEEAEGTLGSEISKKLRNIIESTGLEKLANVLTEEEVADGEQNKIKEILQDKLANDFLNVQSDNGKPEYLNDDLIDNVINDIGSKSINTKSNNNERTSKEASEKLDSDIVTDNEFKERKQDEL